MFSKGTILTIIVLLSVCSAQDYIIEIDQGQLNGRVQYDRKGGDFYSFQRIPYAKPPVGELRFKAPQPADTWDGILDATQESPSCPQENAPFSEDCLYLNVYTPQLPAESYESLLDVMVYIYGGSFQTGSNHQELYGPEYLIPENIILVTLNYRLGIFGSFNLDDISLGYPGNLNMKDQILGLQWVQSNIAKFGGNPNSVTVFGQSAGSASVHYLTLSPMSYGLFHKAIMQSGTALCSWAQGIPNNGILIAEALGISTDNAEEMLEELNRLSTNEINSAQQELYNQLSESQWAFLASPIAEQEMEGQTAFLTERPLSIIQQGNYNQIPLLIGYNNADGINFHQSYTETYRLIPADLAIETDPQEALELTEQMDTFYFDSELFEEPIVQMYTDIWFGHPAYRSASEHQKTSNSSIYFYKFTAETQLNMKWNQPITSAYNGAIHSDEICYIFKSVYQPIEIVELGSPEGEAIDRVVSLWTNFAKYSDPTPTNSTGFKWMPLNDVTFNFVDIGSTETLLEIDPDAESMRFWTEIYNEYGSN